MPVMTAIRYLLVILGTWAVSRGWIAADSVESIATALVVIMTAGWGIWQSRDKAKIEQVAEMPNVKRVVADLSTVMASDNPKVSRG